MFQSGELMQCPGCTRKIQRVAAASLGSVRKLDEEQQAVAGSATWRCPRCGALAEVRVLPLELAA